MPTRRTVRARLTSRRVAQRGSAIISVLLVVALSVMLVASILWRQQVQLRRIENQWLLAQAQWVTRGTIDWTRLMLRSEGETSTGITYLGGAWANPIARTSLSDLLGQTGGAPDSRSSAIWLSGSIEDAQARFNLRNLVANSPSGMLQLNISQIQAFQRLLQLLGMNGQLAKNAAVYLRAGLAHSATRFQVVGTGNNGTSGTLPQIMGGSTLANGPGLADDDNHNTVEPLMMTDVDALLNVPGFTPAMIERLRPFVTVLPTATPVNMNTAPAEVIAAVVPGMNLVVAQAFVARRQAVFFRNMGDVQLALGGTGLPNVQVDSTQCSVDTNYFFIHSRIQYERAEVDRTTLVWRDSQPYYTTRIVRVRDA